MMSRIEQVISDIEAYLDDCKFQPFSNTKIIVDKDQLEDMLAELRLKTPEEIKKYQKIINNKEAIETWCNICGAKVPLKRLEGKFNKFVYSDEQEPEESEDNNGN